MLAYGGANKIGRRGIVAQQLAEPRKRANKRQPLQQVEPASLLLDIAPDIAPDIVVVIPVHKQPLFMVEAIASVLAQATKLFVVVVVVDDGCPLPSTYHTASLFAARYPDRLLYLRRENGGLSAARNSGIEFALKAWPDFKAIYFLDSDNRILPAFLDRAFHVLEAGNAGWAYPDIDMFGIPGFYSTRGAYSLLLHLSYNYCEAGSLVSRAVFERGARFDEAMKLGFEDWEFWWQAAELGFHGVFVPRAGFSYRRRGESMLSQSERNRPEILAYMRCKHKQMFRVGNLLQVEAGELPRYRLALVDRDEVHAVLDPTLWSSAEVSSAKHTTALFVESFGTAEYSPAAYGEPRLIAVAHSGTIEKLTRVKLIRYIFWLAENTLRRGQFLIARVYVGAAGQLAVRRAARGATAEDLAGAAVLFASGNIVREIVRDPHTGWVESLAREFPMPKVAVVDIELPAQFAEVMVACQPYAVVARMVSLLGQMRQRCQSRPALPLDWREDKRMSRRDASKSIFADLGLGTVLPHLPPKDRKQVGFLLPIFDFGGVEKVVANYALILRRHGYDCHLFMTEQDHIEFSGLFDSAFESLNFIGADEQYPFDWSLGAPILGGISPQNREALGLLATMDVVFNTHGVKMHGLIGELKRLGAKTYVGLHLNEITSAGLASGNANFALAYEHVYDGFVVVSEGMRHWCVGRSVPAEKIHLVRNAPSYEIPESVLTATQEMRNGRAALPGKLRVLYLGRLDAQKGLDRLAAINQDTAGPLVEWRIVGRAVVGSPSDRLLPAHWVIEPPAMTAADLTMLYQWADVVVMPSRFEGVPLILLEAQRLGVVVIATDVGAVAEIVTDRVDGFLVDPRAAEAAIVSDFVAIIGELASDRAMLHRISIEAAGRVGELRWKDTMAAFVGGMTALLDGAAVN